jgi:hypothetical protein
MTQASRVPHQRKSIIPLEQQEIGGWGRANGRRSVLQGESKGEQKKNGCDLRPVAPAAENFGFKLNCPNSNRSAESQLKCLAPVEPEHLFLRLGPELGPACLHPRHRRRQPLRHNPLRRRNRPCHSRLRSRIRRHSRHSSPLGRTGYSTWCRSIDFFVCGDACHHSHHGGPGQIVPEQSGSIPRLSQTPPSTCQTFFAFFHPPKEQRTTSTKKALRAKHEGYPS